MLGAAVDSAGKLIGVWPPTVEFIAGPPPVNGTWMMSTPYAALNSSPARCAGVPVPAEE